VTLSSRLLCALLIAAALPLRAQVVGHLPSESPFTDAFGRHIVSGYLGYLGSVDDPAGVGPKGGVLLALTYDYDFPSAFYLTTRVGIAPSTERAVLDPLFTGPQRNLGTQREPLLVADFGLGASLTGEKAWRGITPRVVGSFGYIGTTDPDYDIGQYRFGSKFTLSTGLNIRGVTGKRWEWRADLTRSFYRMNYPGLYRGGSAIGGSDPILTRGPKNPWTGQTFLAIGIARVWGY
jgi:hypothetical protein